ncbi:hypothetical protein [Nocardioides yefusunii]|uniref:Uncharacterized protein n=1 Tax=Nocardioides yefusunii TaxID=2500546 RepID=A0ABW1QW24_9ACTN|nr:hypothetical protein [Nocardioides yefusunii]
MSAPAQAAAPKITTDDLPTLGQVTKIYPDLAKTKAKLETEKLTTYGYATSCSKTKAIRVTKGLSGTYWSKKGNVLAQVNVVDLKSTAVAKKVIAGSRLLNTCGTIVEDGSAATFKAIKAPKLGAGSVGSLLTLDDEKKPRMAYFDFRTKNRVVSVTVVSEKKKIDVAEARKLAKVAFKAAS